MTLTREDDALAEWESSRPDTFYDPALDHLGIEGLREFGETVARVVDPAVAKLEARRDRPMTDGHRVVFDPAYETAGRAVWASGVVPAAAHEQAALLYLLAHAGEGGTPAPWSARPALCVRSADTPPTSCASGFCRRSSSATTNARNAARSS